MWTNTRVTFHIGPVTSLDTEGDFFLIVEHVYLRVNMYMCMYAYVYIHVYTCI